MARLGRPKIRSAIETRQQREMWAKEHPERMRELRRRWCRNNPGKPERGAREERKRLRREVIAAYGARCEHCGDNRWEVLTIDHVHGGGTQHRKELAVNGSTNFYRWLREQGFPREDYRLLCYNCNCARAHAGGLPPVPFESSLALLGGWGG